MTYNPLVPKSPSQERTTDSDLLSAYMCRGIPVVAPSLSLEHDLRLKKERGKVTLVGVLEMN